MTDMIEQMARVYHEERGVQASIGTEEPHASHGAMEAALRTLLSPTPEMVEAGARALCEHDGGKWSAKDFRETPHGEDPMEMREGYRDAALSAFQAMIKAELKE